MSCNGQLDLGTVAADANGSFDDPAYIAGLGAPATIGGAQNVALLSVNAAAGSPGTSASTSPPVGSANPDRCSTYLAPTPCSASQ